METAKQIQFESLEEFIRKQNNFYGHFLNDIDFGYLKRDRSSFKRFQEAHPELEKEITKDVVRAIRNKPRLELPYEKLWEAYKLMSNFVYPDDKFVRNDDGTIDSMFLIR